MDQIQPNGIRFLFLLIAMIQLVACGKSSSGSSSSESRSCSDQTSTHSGCCSSHGGFSGLCEAGQAMYTGDGYLVCNDGSVSPTCHAKASNLDADIEGE